MRLYLCYNLGLGKTHLWRKETIPLSQYYPQQSGPYYPPPKRPEEDYYEADYEYEYDDDEYEDSDNPWIQRSLWFCGLGLLLFLCLACCILLGVGLWFLDPGSSLVSTPIPGSDIGLSFEEPAFPDESVVNEQKTRLTILDVNRNAAIPDVQVSEGNELVIVTVELVNLGEEEISFNERDFTLRNPYDEEYDPITGVVDGALGRGSLPGGSGLEGRLVFEVVAGEFDLVLVWDVGPDSEPRYIYLE
jgi:hypothetical protein